MFFNLFKQIFTESTHSETSPTRNDRTNWTSTDSLYAELTDDAYYRMLEDGADSKTIYSGQPPQVQTALQNRFLEERMEYQREKAKFEQLMREHSKLEAVFAPMLLQKQFQQVLLLLQPQVAFLSLVPDNNNFILLLCCLCLLFL